jgi:Protein of unknown function (DUF2490)
MRKIFLKLLPAAILPFIAAVSLYGQNVYFPGAVPFIALSASVSKKLDLSVLALSKIRIGDYEIRSVKYEPGPTQFYSHAILSYKLTPHWQMGGGFAFQRNDPFRSDWKNDYRVVEQFIYSLAGAKWKLNNRLKIEERWFYYPDGSSNFGTRIRCQPTFMQQLNGWKVYWEVYDELYAIPSGPRNSFISENWFYTGIGFTASPSNRLDTGFGFNSVVMNTHHDLNSLCMLQVMWNHTF